MHTNEKALLELTKISKSFGGVLALRDIDLKVKTGNIVGLIGPNGAGKTTLFNVIAGVYQPDSGAKTFKEEDITKLKPEQACEKGIGRTFQIVKPFGLMSVLHNIMAGAFLRCNSTKEAGEIAMEISELIELSAWLDMPACDLPLPGLKRLELARALATKPELLLLDEVMSGCNPTEMMNLLDLLRKLRDSGITLVVVEHVMKAVMSISDRVVLLHHGEKITEGTPMEVANDERAIKAYLGAEYAVS